MPVLESIARGYENFRHLRENSPLFRIGTNAAGMYGTLSVGGNLLSTLTGIPEIDTIADMAAPVVAGGYAWSAINGSMPNSNLGDTIKVLIAAGIGYDLAGEISSIPSHSSLSLLNDIYSGTHSAVSRMANSLGVNFPSLRPASAIAGGLAAMLGMLNSYSRRIRNERAAARPLLH